MKTKSLLDRLHKLLQRPPEKARLKKLRKTIKALKEKQKDLEDQLERADGSHARKRLQQKIAVLRAQRKKGAAVYRELKAANTD